MADEITITQTIQVKKGAYDSGRIGDVGKLVDQAAASATAGGGNPGIVDIGTSEENIAFGDISTLGWCYLKNLDPTNFVKWGASATTPTQATVGRLNPNEPGALFRLEPGITLRMQADTASCRVLILAFED